MGTGYGALWGTLAPSLDDAEFTYDRHDAGGLWLGMPVGVLAGGFLAHALDARTRQVFVPASAGIFGLGMGTGLGWMLPREPGDWQPARIGAVAGSGALVAGSILAESKLRLADGLGPSAPGLISTGMPAGAFYGMWLAGLVSDEGFIGTTPGGQIGGGVLMGASAGAATGIVLSKLIRPRGGDYVLAYGSSAAGLAMGAGVTRLALADAGRGDAAAALGGAISGLLGGAVAAHAVESRPADFLAATLAAPYGALIGTLAPSLHEPTWNDGRPGAGGALLGVGAAPVLAFAASHATDASSSQVLVPSTAGLFGLGMGAGLGWMLPRESDDWQPARIGAVAGTGGLVVASLLAEPRLRLADGLGPSAPGLFLTGGASGAFYGLWLAGLVSHEGLIGEAPAGQVRGGLLFGGSAGAATGLVLSKAIEPDGTDFVLAYGTSLAGLGVGAGAARLVWDEAGRGDSAASLGGALAGLLGGALTAHFVEPRPVDFLAATLAAPYGALLGTLAPSLHEATWNDGRPGAGGALVGTGGLPILAFAAAHATDATTGQVILPASAAVLGTATGAGFGLLVDDPGDPSAQAQRIGVAAGSAGFVAASLLTDRWLHLSQGPGPSGGGMGIVGAGFGVYTGRLLGIVADPAGTAEGAADERLGGGMLAGGALGTTGGLVLSKFFEPGATDHAVALSAAALGALAGAGVPRLTVAEHGRADAVGELSGALAGFALGATVQHVSPLERPDALALLAGASFGGFAGALSPSLPESEFPGWTRPSVGGLLVGTGAGAFVGTTWRHLSGARASTVGTATLGGLDGAMAGLGVGMLVGEPGSQAERIGAVAGLAPGLALGALHWSDLQVDPGDAWMISGASAVAGWTGAWLPALDAARLSDVDKRRAQGGVLAGVGLASMGTSLLVPAVEVEPDLVQNALALDATFSAAGAGVGMLASSELKGPAWGVVGGGTAGLLVGGALHRSIDLGGEDQPLLTLAVVEGLWLGALTPFVLREPDLVTSRHTVGGFLAGGFGLAGAAVAASGAVEMSGRDAFVASLGSAIGASVLGGGALVADGIDGRGAAGLVMGGTVLGGLGGAWLAPRLDFRGRGAAAGAIGGLLGASEALLFAWAGRGATADDFAGSALVGAGLGTTLGLAAAAYPNFTMNDGLASAGFAAWGAWMGSFVGASIEPDAHPVFLGGLTGADVGFLAGYGLLRLDVIEPRDFGWLSLAGALGTVAGGLAGAPFSSTDNRDPLWVGLAAGPAVGMTVGAIFLPKLRALRGGGRPSVARLDAARTAGMRWFRSAAPAPSAPRLLTSAEMLEQEGRGPKGVPRFSIARALVEAVGVEAWMPMFGALPQAPGVPGPPPLLIGVTGILR